MPKPQRVNPIRKQSEEEFVSSAKYSSEPSEPVEFKPRVEKRALDNSKPVIAVQGRLDDRANTCGAARNLYLLNKIEQWLKDRAIHGMGGEQATINVLLLAGIEHYEKRFSAEGTVFEVLEVD